MANQRILKTTLTSAVTNGTSDSDTWVIADSNVSDDLIITGGTSAAAVAAGSVSDFALNKTQYFETNTSLRAISGLTGINTATTFLGTAYATDAIEFRKSGDFTNLNFTQVEKIKLAEGVKIILDAETIENAFDAAGEPGVHFYGTLGGQNETVTIGFDDSELQSANAATNLGKFTQATLELDDAGTSNVMHDGVTLIWDFRDAFDLKEATGDVKTAIQAGLARAEADGTQSSEVYYGSDYSDYFKARLGDDKVFAGKGNDFIYAGGGADNVDLGAGDDFYLVSGFRGLDGNGAGGKQSIGAPEWEAGDVVNGGAGWDIFRINVGANDTDTGLVILNSTNFKTMEEVQVGTVVGRQNAESSDTQMMLGHYYLNASETRTLGSSSVQTNTESFNNVVVDASAVANALTFTGNGNKNTFIGTKNADKFVGNGGNDVFTGNAGNDLFYFGKVVAKTGANYANVYTAITSNDYDTITDFASGKDKLYLDKSQFGAFTAAGKIASSQLAVGSAKTGSTANLYLETFDSDGDGSSDSSNLFYSNDSFATSIKIVELVGVTSIKDADIVIYDSAA